MAGQEARAPQRRADGRACSRSLLAAAVAVAAVAALASVTLPRSQPPAALDAQQSAPPLQPSLDPHASPETPRHAVASGGSGRRDQAQAATAPPPRNPATAEHVETGTATSPPQHYVVSSGAAKCPASPLPGPQRTCKQIGAAVARIGCVLSDASVHRRRSRSLDTRVGARAERVAASAPWPGPVVVAQLGRPSRRHAGRTFAGPRCSQVR